MLQHNPLQLPSAEDLPETDHTPVDSELQILVPSLLAAILTWYWQKRTDWFWGINLGIYYIPKAPAIVPDGFLSLGVDRVKSPKGRLSYVVWEENNVVPLLVLEFVSKTYGNEYDTKKVDYARMGVLYYVVYNPEYSQRDRYEPLEVYRLIDKDYVLQPGDPVWIPEMGLAIGREQGSYRGWAREWLYWYDPQGNRLPSPEEVAQRLAAKLKEMGIDPDLL
ncbi:Uma2 family endonuclease [Phormidesmis priestleyi ULC007]|uniref:Uma2 family endonuclease n=2 Tax=Phormidesmis priestleyi TaxID=268141 RepID=A0A2T1DLK0_9CYAN|nr:Uma2 family endonuclease [Phormidesmis priestleyi]PSB21331.1 Uma2 family endonuclease [Phormidesmis priestleyi ULC007]PZO51376.1 MAG: Uma2 family endonuclease [Phormidesmis priestleyi]